MQNISVRALLLAAAAATPLPWVATTRDIRPYADNSVERQALDQPRTRRMSDVEKGIRYMLGAESMSNHSDGTLPVPISSHTDILAQTSSLRSKLVRGESLTPG